MRLKQAAATGAKSAGAEERKHSCIRGANKYNCIIGGVAAGLQVGLLREVQLCLLRYSEIRLS